MCGVYPIADAMSAGDEISSTYEGRHLTFLESELTHPDNSGEEANDYVNKGDPVVVGERIVGVALKDGTALTNPIAIDTEGIWVLDVYAHDIDGASVVAPGDQLYIEVATCIISKTRYPGGYLPFGIALGDVDTGTKAIAVKVHFDPSELVIIGGVNYFTSINVGGAALLGGGASVAGTTDLQTVLVHSSLGVAAGGLLTFSDGVDATLLPAADPTVAGRLWCNAGVVTRSAG